MSIGFLILISNSVIGRNYGLIHKTLVDFWWNQILGNISVLSEVVLGLFLLPFWLLLLPSCPAAIRGMQSLLLVLLYPSLLFPEVVSSPNSHHVPTLNQNIIFSDVVHPSWLFCRKVHADCMKVAHANM